MAGLLKTTTALSAQQPFRLAVVGCGAMSRHVHLPVLAGHPGIEVTALVDRDLSRVTQLARDYGVSIVLDDLARLDEKTAEGVLLVTPPGHHARATIDLVRRGFHVLVEKPMALNVADAQAMVDAAAEAHVVLTVGHHRRLYPATRMLRALVEAGTYGPVRSFDIEEGGVYSWKLATVGSLAREQGGGGVLADIGCHLLDQILFCLPGPAEVLEFRDNARGGIETDCQARLRIDFAGRPIEGRLELSRTRKLRGSIRVVCERATLELFNCDRERIHIHPTAAPLIDSLAGEPTSYQMHARWANLPDDAGWGAYRVEFDDWISAIRTGRPPLLDARTVVPVVEVVESCYQQAQPLPEPWVDAGLRTPSSATSNGLAPIDARPLTPTRPRRVLLTGATGFIGCRTAEALHLGRGWAVRALVHNPASAARLARLPVEMVSGDLSDPETLKRVLGGCDAVVHCAVGPSWGPWKNVFRVNAHGTRNLAEAALAAGVRRFVHLSTIAIYGSDVPSLVEETTPLRPDPHSAYAMSKRAAEKYVASATKRGLPAVILRPAHVYGPFGNTFTINPLQHLTRGALVLVEAESTPSNTVHVDNVVAAIARALEAPEATVKGQVFNLSSEDDLTWGEFWDFFSRSLNLPLRFMPLEEWQRQRERERPSRWKALLAWPGSWFRGAREILSSQELRSLARKWVQTPPYGRLPRWLLENSSRLRRLAGLEETPVFRLPESPLPEKDLVLRGFAAKVSMDKAKRVLDLAPALPREQALGLTLDWWRQARLEKARPA
jgi:predicted dehydrogenase/nucleoside-diphosphate-sugar epimerase